MGKRRTPSSSSCSSTDILRRRILSSFPNSPLFSMEVESIACHLRSHYPDYSRLKLIPFTNFVRKTLNQIPNQNIEEIDDDIHSPARKLQKSNVVSHERLLRVCPASASTSSSSGDDDSTSSNVESKFDLTKSMLRQRYSEKSKAIKQVGGELVVEIDKMPSARLEAVSVDGAAVSVSGAAVSDKGVSGVSEDSSEKEGPRFRDFGGMGGLIEELRMRVIVHFYHMNSLKQVGVKPPAGILFHGPPGCGKTMLAHAIANEAGVPFYKIAATELVTGVAGASEENIRNIFEKAYRTAPSVIFIDEIDAIASKRENMQREMERRIVTQLMSCMEQPYEKPKSGDANSESENSEKKPGFVLVIGATNRPDAIDPALRRPGRFDREFSLGVPDEKARAEILSVLAQNLRVDGQIDFLKIARSTPGFVAADLVALVNQAGMLAFDRIMEKRKYQISDVTEEENYERKPLTTEEHESLIMTSSDFEKAAKNVQPSSGREGFSAIQDVKWEDVGGLDSLRKEFERYIVQRIKHPEAYEEFGINLETGFMLYGPPGCGKTLVAKAVANEAGANFIHIKGPELLNKYVGESEQSLRTIFRRAQTCSPCIIFFDEIDALTTKRGKEEGGVVDRFVNQLLAVLEGSEQQLKGVYVIGATNRLEVVDPALLRPGRFGKVIYVPIPKYHERLLILQALARKKPISTDLDFDALAKRTDNFSGADLAALMNEAAMVALEEKQNYIVQGFEIVDKPVIKMSHFEHALKLNKIMPSVSAEDRRTYDEMSNQL